MSAVVRLDREKFEQILSDLEDHGSQPSAAELRDAVLPEPTARWAIGYGRRRHVVHPELVSDDSQRHQRAASLCGNFVAVRSEGRDVTNTGLVMAKDPCARCTAAATSRGLTL